MSASIAGEIERLLAMPGIPPEVAYWLGKARGAASLAHEVPSAPNAGACWGGQPHRWVKIEAWLLECALCGREQVVADAKGATFAEARA